MIENSPRLSLSFPLHRGSCSENVWLPSSPQSSPIAAVALPFARVFAAFFLFPLPHHRPTPSLTHPYRHGVIHVRVLERSTSDPSGRDTRESFVKGPMQYLRSGTSFGVIYSEATARPTQAFARRTAKNPDAILFRLYGELTTE